MYERVDCTEKIIWGYKFRDGATYISLPMDVGVNRRASVGKPYQHSGARNLCNSKSNIRSNDWLVTKAFRRKWLDATKRHAITATVLPQSFESVVGAFVVRAGLLNSRSGSHDIRRLRVQVAMRSSHGLLELQPKSSRLSYGQMVADKRNVFQAGVQSMQASVDQCVSIAQSPNRLGDGVQRFGR